jgi:hypothetical protein
MISWHIPPACQGQIVEVAYGIDSEYEVVVRRITDRSDNSVQYAKAPIDALPALLDRWDFEPWNYEPKIDADAWVEVAP